MKFLDFVEIAGFKAYIEDINETLKLIDSIKSHCCDGCVIQLMDAKAIAGIDHIEHGVVHGMNAFNRGENIANNLGIEICLRTSATRQISKALEILGLKKGEMDLCVVMINCPDYFIDELSSHFIRDDSVLNEDISLLEEIYHISSEELKLTTTTTTNINNSDNNINNIYTNDNPINISSILIDRTTSLIIE